jgi:hypothetical protein
MTSPASSTVMALSWASAVQITARAVRKMHCI